MSSADDLLADIASIKANPPPVVRTVPPPQELSTMDKMLAKVPTGLVNNKLVTALRGYTMGMADPVVGTAQFAVNALPDATGIPQAVNDAVRTKEKAYQDERGPDAGIDPARIAGNFTSPANLAMALRAAPALTTGARAIQGMKLGAAGSAAAPVDVGESGKYWQPKAVEIGVGTVTGGVLAPVVGIVGDKVAGLINRMKFDPKSAAAETDNLINGALAEAGQKIEDVPAGQLQTLRDQVQQSLSQGKKLDAAAALRKADFDAEGIKPTLGQITRDPIQFASEQNTKGVAGVGGPLTMRLAEGNRAVTAGIGKYGADATEGAVAGPTLADALRKFDAGKSSEVTAAYKTARASAGKDLDIPMQGLAQDYADVSHRFDLPGGVKRAFEDYGLGGGKQTKVFTFEEADKLRKVINDHVGGDTTINKALGELRTALNSAQANADVSGGPFAPAVKLAAQRFKMHDEIPALEAAVHGNVDDKFVQTHVINSRSTESVKRLADLLRENAPEQFQQVRSQIGAELARKAFGENVAGDKTIAQESYNSALRNIGTGKLNAFFEPSEVEQLKRLGRIGAYQVSQPAAAASNYSNTASALANILRSGGGLPVAGRSLQFMGNKVGEMAAMSPKVPEGPNLTPTQRAALARLIAGGSGGGGLATAAGLIGQQP